MHDSDGHDHDPLVDELRNLFDHDDPVPPLVTETAKAALGWRRLDGDLAELLTDSSLENESLALARGAGATLRSVGFSSGGLTIDLEIDGSGEGWGRDGAGPELAVLGQISPPARARIEVQTLDQMAPIVTECDELGRFRIELAAANAFRLRVATGDPAAPEWIETSWIPV